MRISQDKKTKISEQILSLLYDHSPKSLFTAQIARDIIRDEEFTKSLLKDLEKKDFIVNIDKNNSGKQYLRRQRWRISNKVYDFYKSKQQSI
jgi:hypothetical protein